MAVSDHRLAKDKKPKIYMRIGLFIRQVFDEMRKVVAPSGFELLKWSFAVFVFVFLLMLFTTGIDFGFGRLMFTLFG